MMLENIYHIFWFLLALIYLFLWIGAYFHRVNEKDQLSALSPYWCFCDEVFDDSGKKFCKKGKIIVLLFVVLLVLTNL
ncbi:MAG: hypothetical protein KTR20_09280 [Cellvibrionaceae bacterium]|nr:hypothetical protein [Cellvibrionaceae bacterium]